MSRQPDLSDETVEELRSLSYGPEHWAVYARGLLAADGRDP